jgi:UDP-N-acetylglucosamine 4-epimerase
VYASSSSVYGDDTNLPKCESTIGNVLSPYAATKRINEVYAKLYNQCYGIETIGLRYFNVFGPKQNPNGDYAAVIPKFITLLINNMSPKINGDGNASRDFTYVDNVVYANILALTIDNFKCYGEEFNIGAGGCTSVLDLFYSIRDMLQSSVSPTYAPYRSGDILMSNANISKATDLLGYTPSVDLITGLEHTIKYFYEKDNTLQSR